MKKIHLTLFGVLLIAAFNSGCAREDLPEEGMLFPRIENTEKQPHAMGRKRVAEEVNKMLEITDGDSQTRAGEATQRSIANIYLASFDEVNGQFTKKKRADVDESTFYIVNFENNAGFAIASTDKRTEPVYAIIDSGNMNPGEKIDNPGFLIFLDLLKTYQAETIREKNKEEVEKVRTRGENNGGLPEDYLEPATLQECNATVASKWSQNSPYNDNCPLVQDNNGNWVRPPAGCVATAVAQVMHYHGHPAPPLLLLHNGHIYNWVVMQQHISTNYLYPPSYPPAYSMIANLLADIGLPQNLNMQYGATGSGSSLSYVPRTFANFGYAKSGVRVGYNEDRIKYSIALQKPVILGGERIDNAGNKKGHAWVVHGFRTYSQKYHSFYYAWDGSIIHMVYTYYSKYIYCNYGFNGNGDGWFSSGAFYASPVGGTYQYNLDAVVDISPN